MEHELVLRHSVRKKQDYLFRLFVALRKFSTGTTRQAVFHLLFNRIFWKLFVIGKRPLGVFHSTKTSSVNFRQLPVASGTASENIPKQRTTSRRIPKFFEKFSRKFSFQSTFLPEFSVEWVAFRKFDSFRNFWKLVREISVTFATVTKFSKVSVIWKALHVTYTHPWPG